MAGLVNYWTTSAKWSCQHHHVGSLMKNFTILSFSAAMIIPCFGIVIHTRQATIPLPQKLLSPKHYPSAIFLCTSTLVSRSFATEGTTSASELQGHAVQRLADDPSFTSFQGINNTDIERTTYLNKLPQHTITVNAESYLQDFLQTLIKLLLGHSCMRVVM
jgi:hypothetical protein